MKKLTFRIATLLLILILLSIVLLKIGKQPTGLLIEIESNAQTTLLYYDSGNGFSPKEAIQATTQFMLPDRPIKQICMAPYIVTPDCSFSVTHLKISRLNKTFIDLSGNQLSDYIKPLSEFPDTIFISIQPIVQQNPASFLLTIPTEQLVNFSYPSKTHQKRCWMFSIFFIIVLILIRIIWLTRKPIANVFRKINTWIDGNDDEEENSNGPVKHRNTLSQIFDPFSSMKIYWFLFLIISIIYIIFYSGANSNLITFAGHDDALFFHQAQSISQLTWLGGYHSLTLAKMPGYAIFLSFCMATGIPYLLFISLCYSVAVAFFLHRTLWIFDKTKLLSFLMGMAFLYNPLFNGELRIYRNQLASMCLLIFLGVILSMFNPNAKKESNRLKITTTILSFFGMGFLFYTREENILYYGILFLSGISFLLVFKKIRSIGRNLYPMIAGLSGILVMGFIISLINLICYGRFTTCERTSAPFTTAIHAFHTIDDPNPDPRYPKVTASQEKILQVAEVIPEFKSVASTMCDTTFHSFKSGSTYLDKKDMTLKEACNNCIPVSHFEWFWISSIDKAGYYSSAPTVASFYKGLTRKIDEAIKTGKLKKRSGLIPAGPYCIDKEDIYTIFRILPKNYHELFLTPKQFLSCYLSFTVKPVPSGINSDELLSEWGKKLHLNYLHYNDKAKIDRASHSLNTAFWNGWVVIFAFFFLPLMHLATQLAIVAIIRSFCKREKTLALGLIVLLSGYVCHFLLLSVVDVAVGFDASSIAYYLPSYNLILATFFISLTSFFKPR